MHFAITCGFTLVQCVGINSQLPEALDTHSFKVKSAKNLMHFLEATLKDY